MSTPLQAFETIVNAAARVVPISELDNFKAACQQVLDVLMPKPPAEPAAKAEPKP